MSSQKIFRAISAVSLGTLVARFFGLGREVATANFFGTTGIYDAFLIAFMIPNFFRGLLAEGALNAAFIPVFTEYSASGEDKKKSYEVFHLCFTVSLVLTLSLFAAILAFSFIMSGAVADESKWFQVWMLLRFTFPYLIFISLTALNMGVLNVYKNFFLPSLSPVILDIFWVGALFLLLPLMGSTPGERIYGLCLGVIAGGIGQFIFTLVPVLKRGYTVRLNFNFRHPAMKKMGKLLLPVIAGVAVVPINLLVDYSLANTLYDGAVSGLWYGTRIFQLPLGIFAISISTAILPWLAEDFSSKNYLRFTANLRFALRMLILLMLPFTFGMIILRTEIVTLLFSRGLFSGDSVRMAASPLAFYSLGLAGYGGVSVLARAFYSCGDTVTPVKVGLLSIVTNLFLNIALMKFLNHSGIALSTAVVGIMNFALLLWLFNRKHLKINVRELVPFTGKSLVISASMGVILCLWKRMFQGMPLPLTLFSAIIVAVLFYLACLKLFFFKGRGFYIKGIHL